MPSSRASLIAALVLAAGLPGLAWAETPAAGDPPGTPTMLKVIPSPVLEEGQSPAPRLGAGETRFQMEELKAPDVEAVGVLEEKQGGFGPALWKGSQADLVRAMLPHLPATPSSRALRSLQRRLLLTAAVPPEGGAKGMGPSLLELRAERLYAMGEVDGLAQLLKAAPSAIASPGLSRLKMDAYLLAGDAKAACSEFALLPPGNPDPRMQVFCMVTGGKTLEANMALDLMRERKDADHAFIAAAEAMTGTPPPKVEKLPNPTPLHLAAFKSAKMPLPADAAAGAPPAMLRAMADSVGLPVETRILAAERAEALGALDVDSLRKIYGAVTMTPAEQQAAQGQGDKTPRSRVLLLRAAQGEQSPAVRAELISRVLITAAERGAFAQTARIYAPVIAELKPAPELAPFAPPLARALYAAGRPEAAGNWTTLAKSDPAAAKAVDDLWLMGRLTRPGAEPAISVEAVEAWAAARELPADQAERRLLVALELLQAQGEKLPPALWLPLAKNGHAVSGAGPRPALKALQRSAAEGKRLGETILLSLAALGEVGLDKADPDSLNRTASFLHAVGLDRDARDLAVEAAMANGI